MAYTGSSIVDYLKDAGSDSSYSARAKLAASLGISNYKGTAAQNTQLLGALRGGASAGASSSSTTSAVSSNYNKPAGTAVLNNPNQALASVIAEVKAAAGQPVDTYVRPDYTSVVDPKIYDSATLEQMLGVDFTYDRGEIEKILSDAVSATYGAREQEGRASERQYYKNMAANQNTMLDTVRSQQAQATLQGVNKGAQMAQTLSAMIAGSQATSDEATLLANDRAVLAKEKQAAAYDAVSQALDKSNAQSNQIATISHQLYNDMIQQKAAELSYNQGINTDYAGYLAAKYGADASMLSSMASAGAGVYNNNQSALAAIEQAIQNSAATRYAADSAAAATRYAANAAGSYGLRSSGGGNSAGYSESPIPVTTPTKAYNSVKAGVSGLTAANPTKTTAAQLTAATKGTDLAGITAALNKAVQNGTAAQFKASTAKAAVPAGRTSTGAVKGSVLDKLQNLFK